MRTALLLATTCAITLSGLARADQVFTDDVIINKPGTTVLCVGIDCVNDEAITFPFTSTIRLKANVTSIEIDDTSGSGFPDRDWRIQANETGGGSAGEAFFIRDVTAGTNPFYIDGNAPDNAIYISDSGQIGFGTSLPMEDLHIVNNSSPTLRLEYNGFVTHAWDISAGGTSFVIQDDTTGTFPFRIETAAPSGSLWVNSSGNIAVGGGFPSAALHLERDNGTARILVEETGAIGAQELFQMKSNGGSYFTMSNTASGRDWFFTHENNLRGRFIITSSTNPSEGLFLDPDGDMSIGGTLTTGGGTCGGGCDAVFSDGYALPSIREHAEAMWSLGHLPNVGPTPENAPINVSDKLGRMLNELEHAHIYIAQQDDKISALTTQMKALQDQLDALKN
jgi:hypothetical protein